MSLLLTITGCTQATSSTPQLSDKVTRADASVVVFFVDGMDRARFEALRAAGKLPNIQKRFVEGGVGVEHAIVAMPAITYANAVSLLTGVFPGHHGVLGNQWFDRRTRFLRDYGFAETYRSVNDDFTRPTMYEILRERFTVNVQGHTRRGVSETIDNWVTAGLDWAAGNYSRVDARVGEGVDEVVALANRRQRWPCIYFNYFPGVDEVGHRFGADSPEYERALCTADTAIGRIVDTVEAIRPARQVFYVLVTDHGHVPSPPEHVFDLAGWLRTQRSRRVHVGAAQSAWPAWRRRQFDAVDTVVINGAFRRGAIHLRGPAGWDEPADPETIDTIIGPGDPDGALHSQEAICILAARAGPDAVRILSRSGGARIERRVRNGVKEYRYLNDRTRLDAHNQSRDRKGAGPQSRTLQGARTSTPQQSRDRKGADDWQNHGHEIAHSRVARVNLFTREILPPTAPSPSTTGKPSLPVPPDAHGTYDSALAAFIAAGWHDSRAWLEATAATQFPDFVPQIVEMFDSPRAGDIVVFAAGDWTFDGGSRGGHGSCVDADMHVPLYFAGPGLPGGGRIACARLVDVMPTIVALLGEGSRFADVPPLDGVSLLPQLRSAATGP